VSQPTYRLSVGAGPSVTFATDKTSQKVTELQQPMLKLPPALDELQTFIFRTPAAKIPVVDSFYNGLVAHNDSLKAIIEPASLSGADILAALVVSALTSEFEGGDEIVIAGKQMRAYANMSQQQCNANKAGWICGCSGRVELFDMQAKWTSCYIEFGNA